MTAPLPPLPPAEPSPAPAALPAFLRGVERRAAVFAELQCGDPATGDAAVLAAMRAFRGGAGQVPLAQWPARFWTLLLSAPSLRRTVAASVWEPAWRGLATLGNGARAALLLRLVAGLDAETAATVLAVAPARYQQALEQALPRDRDGQADAVALQALEEALQHRIRRLPAQRLMQLAQLRERALLGASAAPRGIEAPLRRPRRLLPLWLGVAACAIAFAATFWPTLGPGMWSSDLLPPGVAGRVRGDGTPRIRSTRLPPADPPAARFDADFAKAAHRDFALLADPDGLRQAQALPLMAWYAAELAAARRADTPATPVPVLDAAGPAPFAAAPAGVGPTRAPAIRAPAPGAFVLAPLEAQLQQLPAALRAPLRAQLAAWSGWNEAERAGWIERQQAWNRLPAAERGRQREHYAAWHALPGTARADVAAAALAFALLPDQEQQELRARFAALDRSNQHGWLLGPALGADYPKLQPLLAQLPEAEHAPLLAALQAMDAGERADLAVLAHRVPPQERDALRRALLSTAADHRGAWLRLRLEQ